MYFLLFINLYNYSQIKKLDKLESKNIKYAK
jgi:hypothetical protein